MLERMVTSSVLILVLCALRVLLRGRVSARVMYALWLLVALRLLLPAGLVESPASIMNVVPGAQGVEETLGRPATPAENPAFPETAPALPQSGPESVADAPVTPAGTAAGREFWLVVWAAGALAVAVWFLAVNLRLRAQLRRARRLDTGGKEPVYVAEELPSPCVAGLFRPAIYVTPPCLEDERRMRHVLTHERTHLRHADPLWAWVRCLCLALYWFHPLVWVAACLSRRDCELACDEGTVARLGEKERIPYGRTLVDLVAGKAYRPQAPHAGRRSGGGSPDGGHRRGVYLYCPDGGDAHAGGVSGRAAGGTGRLRGGGAGPGREHTSGLLPCPGLYKRLWRLPLFAPLVGAGGL